MTMLLVGPIMEIIIVINNYDCGLQAVLFPIHGCTMGVMKWAVYLMMLWKTNQIAQLIDYVELVVERRTCFMAKQR